MEEEEDISSPFWLQNGSTNHRRFSRSYSLLLSSGTIIIFLLVITLVFILVVIPTLHSFTSHIFKPNSVKKSWDSLNLLLVLFAIFCGFLSKNNNANESPRSYEDQTFSDINTRQEFEKPNLEPETKTPPRYWYEYSEGRTSYNRLRSFNSYPDLRQDSLWVDGDERWRFNDDTHVKGYRGLDSNLKEEKEKEKESIKNIEVNTPLKEKNKKQAIETHQSETVEKTKNNNAAERKNKKASATKEEKTYHSLKRNKKHRNKSFENFQSLLNSEPTTTMSSSSSSPSIFQDMFSSKKNKQKKHNSVLLPQHHVSSMLVSKTKDEEYISVLKEKVIATGNESPLISIPPPPPAPPPFKMPLTKEEKTYQSLKGNKKYRHKSFGNFQSLLDSEPPTTLSSSSSSPSIFQDMFSSKKNKQKKHNFVSLPQHHVSSMLVSKTKNDEYFSALKENVIATGNESPLISIPPPPPPPPPFKMSGWKFKVQGDFVRIDSMSSTSSGLADIDDEVMESPTSRSDAEPAIDLLVYPNSNPDVDSKAGNFIESFRAGLRMEKMNSMKKQGLGIGRSNLYNTLHHKNH